MLCWMMVRASGYTIRELAQCSSTAPRIHSDCRELYNAGLVLGIWRTHGIYSVEGCSVDCRGTAGRRNRRSPRIAAASATDPYSRTMIHPGTSHGRPSVRKCHT